MTCDVWNRENVCVNIVNSEKNFSIADVREGFNIWFYSLARKYLLFELEKSVVETEILFSFYENQTMPRRVSNHIISFLPFKTSQRTHILAFKKAFSNNRNFVITKKSQCQF